ncbi:MAG: HAD-IIA family hydrolase [Anaerovoracaceae bacterium]
MTDNIKTDRQSLKSKKLFLLDMDGTLYLDDRLFDGAAEFLSNIKKAGGRYIFLTNNSSKGTDSYMVKMERLGIPAQAEDFITSVDAMIYRLKKCYGEAALDRKMYIMGTESFKKQMRAEGFNITDVLEDDIGTLVIGFDRELTFSKLEDACRLLVKDVDYFATNPDWVCPTEYGYVPDCGSFAFMLEKATGRKPEFAGKPEPQMAYLAMDRFGFMPESTLLIGDRLYTDIACGKNAGIDTAFVLSGEGTLTDIEETGIEPEYIFEGVGQISDEIFGGK